MEIRFAFYDVIETTIIRYISVINYDSSDTCSVIFHERKFTKKSQYHEVNGCWLCQKINGFHKFSSYSEATIINS